MKTYPQVAVITRNVLSTGTRSFRVVPISSPGEAERFYRIAPEMGCYTGVAVMEVSAGAERTAQLARDGWIEVRDSV